MRGFLASSIGVTCAVALALPPTPTAAAATAAPAEGGATAAARTDLPGSTQSLPLSPLRTDRTLGPTADQGVTRREVDRYAMVGVVWDDPDTELHGRVQVRTRSAGTGAWSGWQDVETHNDAADPDSAERATGRVRGATAPLWVGESDAVEARVRAEEADRTEETARGTRTVRTAVPLPHGLRLELIDPGEAPADQTSRAAGAPESAESAEVTEAAVANADLAPTTVTEIPALDRAATERELVTLRGADLTDAQRAKPHIGPRPAIVTRRGWGADEKLRERKFVYTSTVKAAFVHHSATGNGYSCGQSASVIRGIYRYHVKSLHWRDIGYNFLVDKCGKIYEGRAGGVGKAVLGAHTLGFNTNSTGIAVLGSFGSAKPPTAAVTAVARLSAWKLGLYGANPRGTTYLKSGGGNLYRKGKNVRLNVISGHRDGFATDCPGGQLYSRLGTIRTTAARDQGR
ncbi:MULTISPECIES: peptidoglycan recognition protein [Streptomyces]|uniref:Peptidoglycan recognition protein n=1 Tax=Streptomyces doudnae TaxID=3075536 RepID=A0ABD5EVH0_9ACTN|nr:MULTISPECIES: peptidoglycan recognition protein [unclassified Streptomyces]MDT0437855.1 peptidoglycan recognition protein [Streptomyces sp. DSM 41981]MYQ63867.1 N-acetylmuramoyl-L-alanine amidase [Streptomyces sp. SID4950]